MDKKRILFWVHPTYYAIYAQTGERPNLYTSYVGILRLQLDPISLGAYLHKCVHKASPYNWNTAGGLRHDARWKVYNLKHTVHPDLSLM
jgi:hypothetical protein